jgi:hypothetical protein
MELLQERFRSSGAAKIVELKSKLETLQPVNKKNVHPYDQTLRYLESIDKIIEERYQVDGSTFADDDLRLATWSALKNAENQRISTVASLVSIARRVRQVEEKEKRLQELFFSDLKKIVLGELRQDKIEADMRKTNQRLKDSFESVETSQSRANMAQGEKRGRSNTDHLQVFQPSKKKSRQNLRDDESRSRVFFESRTCDYCRKKFSQKSMFHKKDSC